MHGVLLPPAPSICLHGTYRDNFTTSNKRKIITNIYVPGFTIVGVLLDVTVWWLGRGLELYEETDARKATAGVGKNTSHQLKR
jgi:hypothetical protein